MTIRCGIHAVSEHGIAGRGVLLDYCTWAKKQGRPYDPVSGHAITAADRKVVARDQNVKFKVGDILFIRGGYIQRYHELEKEIPTKLEELAHEPTFSGVEQSDDMKEFLHDSYVSVPTAMKA